MMHLPTPSAKNSVKAKFALSKRPDPEGLLYEGPYYSQEYYQNLIYS